MRYCIPFFLLLIFPSCLPRRCQSAALEADPAFDPASGAFAAPPERGLRAFARIYSGWGVGAGFYAEQTWRGLGFASFEEFVARSYEGGFSGAHPSDLLAQLQTWRSARPGATDDELSRVTASVLLVPCDQDRYFSAADVEAREGRLIPGAVVRPLVSPWGHRAGDPHRPGQERDAEALRALVGPFLAPPPDGRSN